MSSDGRRIERPRWALAFGLDPLVAANREVNLGALVVTRVLPIRDRRLVGPWCFLDRFGPLTVSEGKPMDVAPHRTSGCKPSRRFTKVRSFTTTA
jgi:hypothetical protein